MDKKSILDAVFAHANANYEKDGWDYIVECFDHKELEELIYDKLSYHDRNDFPTNAEEAIAIVLEVVKTNDDYRREIEATIW